MRNDRNTEAVHGGPRYAGQTAAYPGQADPYFS